MQPLYIRKILQQFLVAGNEGLVVSNLELPKELELASLKELIWFFAEKEWIETDYDESLGIWFLTEKGASLLESSDEEIIEELHGKTIEIEEETDTIETKDFSEKELTLNMKQLKAGAKLMWMVLVTFIVLYASLSYFNHDPDKAEKEMDKEQLINQLEKN